jgi:hypothetical protein
MRQPSDNRRQSRGGDYAGRSRGARANAGKDNRSRQNSSQDVEVEEVEIDEDLLDPNDEDFPEKWEQSVYAQFEQAEKQLMGKPKPFNPEPLKAEELHTSRIGLVAGDLGVGSVMKQFMGRLGQRDDLEWENDEELASQLYRGQVVRFKNEAEKKRVIELAEEFSSNAANRIQTKKGGFVPKLDVGYVPVPEEFKEVLAGKAMRGLYDLEKPVDSSDLQKKTLSHLRKSVQLNETYSPTQGKAMVDFIAKMWPAESGPQKRT